MKQMEMEFTSSDQKTASQPGIGWRPDAATPEQIKEWHDTEGKWWGDRALTFVIIASIIQFGAMAFMLSSFLIIELAIKQ